MGVEKATTIAKTKCKNEEGIEEMNGVERAYR